MSEPPLNEFIDLEVYDVVTGETHRQFKVAVEEVVCWANAWANLYSHKRSVEPGKVLSKEWEHGYQKACSEIFDVLSSLTPEWLETWRKHEWRRLGS